MKSYYEDDSFNRYVEFYNEDSEAYTPTTVRYRIHCLTTDTSIRSWTTLTPANPLTIAVTPDDNVIVSERNRVERRQMTIQADFDTDTQKVSTYEWDVTNLKGP